MIDMPTSGTFHEDFPITLDHGGDMGKGVLLRLLGFLRILSETIPLAKDDRILIDKTLVRLSLFLEDGNLPGAFLMLKSIWIILNTYLFNKNPLPMKEYMSKLINSLDVFYFGEENTRVIQSVTLKVGKTMFCAHSHKDLRNIES